MMSSDTGSGHDFDTVPFYYEPEDVYSDVFDVSSGDAASMPGAAEPYFSASGAAVSSDDVAMLYEQLCNVSDDLTVISDVVKEGFVMVSIFLGLITGLFVMLCLWIGGRR